MDIKKGLRYSKDHEWVDLQGSIAYVGITDYAQHSLGSIVFVELPQMGKVLSAGDVLTVVESVKAASDVYTPVSGRIAEINQDLEQSPQNLNDEPYKSWIAGIETNGSLLPDNLMDEDDYEAYCKQEA